jgi:putative ABC transport system permease protein
VDQAALVAVIGQTIVDELFEGSDPIGETIRVRGLPLEIIGVLERKGMSLMGSVQDDIVLVPYTTGFQRISGRSHAMVINVQVYNQESMDIARAKMTDLLRERHRLAPYQDNDFTIQTQEEVAQAATETSRVMTWLLASIAGISLFVGGIGIMNVMLVSVTERTREVGLRLAVGARGPDVLMQFLIEAVILCLLGGIGGILVGLLGHRDHRHLRRVARPLLGRGHGDRGERLGGGGALLRLLPGVEGFAPGSHRGAQARIGR